MLRDDLMTFVPYFLNARYPGRFREAFPGSPELGWVLEAGDAVALVRAAATQHPFIWIRAGIAHAIPRSEALALHIASQNKDLVVGRVYLAYGDSIAMAVFDEAIFTDDIDIQRESSAQDLVTRFETSLQYTAQWSTTILERFGGQPFTAADSQLMTF